MVPRGASSTWRIRSTLAVPFGPYGGNTLANVARAIDYTDPSQHGYWVGLFSYLELLVLDGAMLRPVFEDWREYESGVRRELCHVLPRGGV